MTTPTPADAVRTAIDALRHATDEEIAAYAIRAAADTLLPRPAIGDRSPQAEARRLLRLQFLTLANELAGNPAPAASREALAEAREESPAAAIEHTPPSGPIAWCRSIEFSDAAIKQQSFNGWRQHHPDCDLALYAGPVPTPAEALAARPLLEQVAAMADCVGAHTVGQITAISTRAAAWLRENPPGQPVALEPRGCPAPGACSCVEPTSPTPVISSGILAALAAEPVGEEASPEELIGLALEREPWATWLRSGGCLESAHCELADLMLAAPARLRHCPTPKPHKSPEP